MQSIDTTLWYDGKGVRPLEPSDAGMAFKWILVEIDGGLMLFAMPKETDLDFHKELRDRVCELKDWDTNKLKVLGGGVRLNDGEIFHRSTYFGKMPKGFRGVILNLLKLK